MTQRAWAIKHPNGRLLLHTVAPLRKHAIGRLPYPQIWKAMYAKGYRVVRVTVHG